MSLKLQIQMIREYTQKNPELHQAHHFLYDLKFSPEKEGCYVMMGINPGESPDNWNQKSELREETSEYDFLAAKRANIRWTKVVIGWLGMNVVQSELFFWSSRDMAGLEQRFGKLKGNKHLAFCKQMNLALFEHYRPKAIIFPGITKTRDVCELYGLTHIRTYLGNDNRRLVEHCSDGHRPWIFTRHLTGARGFTKENKAETKSIIVQIAPG